ncbi:PREDICTED: uncharacterized protein LOC106725933 [Myotis brandtii]|uniref:uncharacterized protein LOC106725933 n=1 Tax=Myotis brandtii TaxID=109478 RepID=UPI000703C8F7|nr:PREDICTED: uncharacterized protein LOC106725933 [Myotis brandtii]
MGTWPDQVQYLGQPFFSSWFIIRQDLVLHSRPAPHTVGLVRSLRVELVHLEPTEAQWEEPPPELKLTPEPEEGPDPGLEPGPAVVMLEPSGPPALIRIPTAEPAPRPTTDYRRAGTPKHLIREEKVVRSSGQNRTVQSSLPCATWRAEGENNDDRNDTESSGEPKQPSRFATLLHYVRGSDKRLQKKGVPLLETFILDLRILDISKKDNLEELNIIKELVLLQEAAQEYKIEPEEEFEAWFWALDRFSKEESYIWSCLLEPQSKVATGNFS